MRRALLPLVAVLLAGTAPAKADMLALKDGRFIEGRKIDATEDGYDVHFENGTIEIPKDRVADYFRVDESGEFIPQTEDEKAKAEKGLAPWKGEWVRARKRQRLIEEELEQRRERLEQQKHRRKWVNHAEVETKHFIFRHTLPDDLFEEFKTLFETYYDVFTDEWRIRPSRDFGKPTINIYHDADYFHQVSGASQGVLGYYMPAERDLHFYYDRDRHRFTIDVMFHEGNHLLTHMIDERVWYPAWINEGLAEYYGASEWDAEKEEMKIGRVQSGRLCVLWTRIEEESWQKLEDLIRTPRIDAIQYAWAWSLCHFLMTVPKYEKRFRKYYLALAQDRRIDRVNRSMGMLTVPPDEQIEHLLEYLRVDSLEELEKEWHEYIKTELSLDRDDLDWAGAGWIMSIYGERAKARKFFRKAIEVGDANGFVHYSYAKLLFDSGHVDDVIEHARKATERDPLHARSWLLLGRALYRKGEKEEGDRLMKLAMELDPDDPQAWVWRELEIDRADD